jgi:holo-[acyl-carrier protein] synthase
MTRVYQGVDLVDIPQFESLFLRNRGFVSEIFTEGEREYCFSMKEPYRHLAGRFAAKEACMKALGMGLSGIDNILKEIEVTSAPSGKPGLSISGWAEKMGRKKKIRQLTVSISHTAEYAVATVVLVGDEVDVS